LTPDSVSASRFEGGACRDSMGEEKEERGTEQKESINVSVDIKR
jgi:hypothetical protein